MSGLRNSAMEAVGTETEAAAMAAAILAMQDFFEDVRDGLENE